MSQCILKSVSDQMKKDHDEGVFNVDKLYSMKPADRRVFFEKYTSPELAKYINGKFEEAMVSKQEDALMKWQQETLNPKQKNGEPYKTTLKKIEDLRELGVLDPKSSDSYLEDLVAQKMGISLTPEEINGISSRAEKLQAAFEKKDSLGLESVDYFNARKDMDRYMQGLNPSSTMDIITDPVRRSNILMHISGVLKKTNTELIEGSLRATAQRLSQLLTGENVQGLNNKLATESLKNNMEKVISSKYNPMLMQELKDDQVFLGEGQPHTEGQGPLRSYARATMSLTQHMYNTPAQFFASLAWTDTANILSTQFADGDQAKAAEFFKDALKIAPDTKEGQEIRMRAMEEGLKASFQNKGALSKATLGIRDALDKIIKGFNLGKQLIPIAKVPANAIGRGLDYAGVGMIRALHKEGSGPLEGWNRLPEAISEMNKGNKLPIQSVVKQFVQSGLGLTLAAIIVHNLNPDDYIPAFSGSTNADKNLKGETNGVYNSIKLGSRYLALSFLGPLAVPVMVGLVAKKEGLSPASVAKGFEQSLQDIPGVSSIQDVLKTGQDIDTKNGAKKATQDILNAASDYFTSIAVPSEVKDLAAGTDSVQRNSSGNPVAKAEAKIPGARETLPPKVSEVIGEPIKEEGVFSRAIMGSNLSKSSDDPVVKEISRLVKSGQPPTFSGLEYTNKSIKNLIAQKDGNATEILEYYGKYYHQNAGEEINSEDYKDMNDEDKKLALNNIHKDAVSQTLDHFDYKKP